MHPRWRVSFRGELTADAEAELAQHGVVKVAGRVRAAADGTEHRLSTTVWLRAADATEAITRVKAALDLYGSFSDFKADPVNYSMYLGFLESEAPALEAAADEARDEDPRISSVIWSEPSNGSAELLLEIPAADQQDAVTQARQLYAELRSGAELPPAEALYGFLGPSGSFPVIPVEPSEPSESKPEPTPRHGELAERAHRLFDEGFYDYAIVASQTSCEVMAFDAITELLDACEDGVTLGFASGWFKTTRTHSLKEDRVRELWNALAGDNIQSEDWWAGYLEHLVRRHGVVHRGTEPSEAEAKQSLKATDSFRAHLDARLMQAQPGDET